MFSTLKKKTKKKTQICTCSFTKGDNYWSFENGVKEPGYPRSVSQDFGGLTGEITAALPVPATRKKPESVYFFKKGALDLLCLISIVRNN